MTRLLSARVGEFSTWLLLLVISRTELPLTPLRAFVLELSWFWSRFLPAPFKTLFLELSCASDRLLPVRRLFLVLSVG